MPILMFVVWVAIMMALSTPASGQDSHTHEGEVGKFYQTWRQPLNRDASGARIQGCCGNQDCRPILQTRKNPSAGAGVATWQVLFLAPWNQAREWISVPDRVWEDNQPDPRESPDERGHICVTYSGYVVCAVRGGDT